VSHQHAPRSQATDRGRLLFALALIVGFVAVEIVGGLLAGSLALLSDAGHMLTDAGAIGMSLLAIRLAAQPPTGGLTFGLKRAEILTALANGILLIAIAVVIVDEAVHRLLAPPPVAGGYLIVLSLVGAAVNLVATRRLGGSEQRSLNVEGSYQHLLTDMYAFVGTAVAGVIILVTGFRRADPIASIFVALLMTRAGFQLVQAALRVLVEAAPEGVNVEEIGEAMATNPHVSNVHDLHVWEITSGHPSLSAHVLVHPRDDCHAAQHELETLLHERFGIHHTTLQVDHAAAPDLVTITDG
jgi:cobalt-zinc-cadmium efflux system protein